MNVVMNPQEDTARSTVPNGANKRSTAVGIVSICKHD